jgi:hypothetical protein
MVYKQINLPLTDKLTTIIDKSHSNDLPEAV